jgi:transcriptional regulator with XRE-family HTH domain
VFANKFSREALSMPATVRLRVEVLREMASAKGWDTDSQIAAGLGIDRGSLSRVLAGKQGVGGGLIAAVCGAFPRSPFERFFEIVPDAVSEQVPA